MGFHPARAGLEASIGFYSYRFGHAAERGRGRCPAHCGGHGDGHELLLTFVERQDDGELGAVTCFEEHAVEPGP
jgi:hypothetical protein